MPRIPYCQRSVAPAQEGILWLLGCLNIFNIDGFHSLRQRDFFIIQKSWLWRTYVDCTSRLSFHHIQDLLPSSSAKSQAANADISNPPSETPWPGGEEG